MTIFLVEYCVELEKLQMLLNVILLAGLVRFDEITKTKECEMMNWNVNYVYEEVKDSNSNVMSVTWVIEHINNSILITKARLWKTANLY